MKWPSHLKYIRVRNYAELALKRANQIDYNLKTDLRGIFFRRIFFSEGKVKKIYNFCGYLSKVSLEKRYNLELQNSISLTTHEQNIRFTCNPTWMHRNDGNSQGTKEWLIQRLI